MRMNRAFILIRRFNSIIPLSILFIAFAAIFYFAFKDSYKPRSFIVAPDSKNQTKSLLKLHRHEFVEASKTWVLSLDDIGENNSLLDGYVKKTKNLLISSSTTGESHWLFPDQSREIFYFDLIKHSSGSIDAIYLNTSSNTNNLVDVFLARPFAGSPVEILSGTLNVIDHQTVNKELHVIYECPEGLRTARFSLLNFKKLSDLEVVKMKSDK
jgi:hypothetical protein